MTLERFGRRELLRRAAEKTTQALGLTAIASLIPQEHIFAEAEPTTITHWDGKEKRINPQGGIKLVFIPGLNTNSQTDRTFDNIKQVLRNNLPFDEQDELDMTYNTDDDAPAVGLHYDVSHANRYPAINYLSLRRLFLWYRKHFTGDKFIVFGHSQGGFMAYLLAREFKDMIAGVITYDSPLKGADIVPTHIDRRIAGAVGGEAARYYLSRADNPLTSDEVETGVASLRAEGMLFSTFSSTTDRVVPSRFSYVDSANHSINGEPITDRFDMYTSTIWPVAQSTQEEVVENLKTLPVDREVKQEVEDSWLGHGAVMANPQVLDQTLTIVKEVFAHLRDPRPDMFSSGNAQKPSEEELVRQEERMAVFLQEKPSGAYFSIQVTSDDRYYVVLTPGKESEGWEQFKNTLSDRQITEEKVWRRLLAGPKYSE